MKSAGMIDPFTFVNGGWEEGVLKGESKVGGSKDIGIVSESILPIIIKVILTS